MNWLSGLIAAIIGGIAGFLASILSDKFLKDKKNKETLSRIVFLSIFIIITAIGNKVILPYIQAFSDKNKLNNELTSPTQPIQLFKYIKKYDPIYYDKILNEMLEIGQNNSGKNANELNLIYFNYGATVVKKYMKNASDDSIIKYTQKILNAMKDLNQKDPDYFCKFIFPGNFGSLEQEVSLSIMKKHLIFESLEDVIKTGVKKVYNDENDNSSMLYSNYRSTFTKNFPQQASYFDKINTIITKDEKGKLANAVILFYENILKLNKSESSKILRKMFS